MNPPTPSQKIFSLLSWNIEHFSLGHTDKVRVVQHIRSFDPDIFALLEVVGADVWHYMFDAFPEHNFFITEGEQSQEILIAVRKTIKFFITQRDEFKSGRTFLRPGSLLSFKIDDEVYSILFLHLKSMNDPEGFGLRADMLNHVFNLKGVLDHAAGGAGKANFIVMGDLNTMGMNYYRDNDITAATELKYISYRAKRRKMDLLPKTHTATWTNGATLFSDLDHTIASRQINFRVWNGAKVKVDGWNRYSPDSPDYQDFIKKVSDHCSLYCEVVEKDSANIQ